MEDVFPLALLVIAALVLGIIALAQLSRLRLSVEDLRRRISGLEGGKEGAAAQPASTKSVPPPLPAYVTQPQAAKAKAAAPVAPAGPTVPHAAFNWESILGVKLFAWIGGLALFLGVVFFVKYAFENNWITPAMRIVAGGIIGIGLVAVSLLPKVRDIASQHKVFVSPVF